MKLRQYIATFFLALAFGAAAPLAGCSDNEEKALYPDSESHISLKVEPAVKDSGYQNGMLSVGSAQSTTVFDVSSSTRWTVQVTECEGAWCQIVYGSNTTDAAGQIGNGKFTVETAPNRSSQPRSCLITVRGVDASGNPLPDTSVEIHLDQDRQSILVDYSGDEISPNGTNAGTEPVVTVTANQAWTASSSHPWVTIVPGDGMDGDGFTPAGSAVSQTVSFRISVQPNPGTSDRFAELTVSSPTSAFIPIRLNVTQKGSTSAFIVTPTNVPVIAHGGDDVKFQVYSSRDNWNVQVVGGEGWLTLDRNNGSAASDPVTVMANVKANADSRSRDASLVFSHGEDMYQIVNITQEGNPDAPDPDYSPVVSAPWLESGWTASHVRIMAYFRSPVVTVTGGGVILYSRYGEQTFEGDVVGNELVITDIRDLDYGTTYDVVAFVTYSVGGATGRATGSAISFTTPNQSGDPILPDSRPVVSTPWLESGWTVSNVRIHAYYQSSIYAVTGGGVNLYSDSSGWQTINGTCSDGLLTVDVQGLERGTEYMAVAFVEYSVGGSTVVSEGGYVNFHTPDQSGNPGDEPLVPNPGDNTPPSGN